MRKTDITAVDVKEYMAQAVIALAADFKGYSSIDLSASHYDKNTPPKVEWFAYNSIWGTTGGHADPDQAIAELLRISKTKKKSELLREQAEAILIKAEVLKKNGY